MADKAPNSAEALTQAYNQAIASGFAIADAGMAQTTANVKAMADAVQAERDEYGKAVENAAGHIRTRGENVASVMQGMSAAPGTDMAAYTAKARESVSKLIEGEMAFYQAWTAGWTDYVAAAEERRKAAAQAMQEGNARMIEAGQVAMQSAAKYGEAFIDWSLDNAKGTKS